ncbi:MAG TPA: hypothetical protein VKT20_01120 [Candidatus Dormibacteraeota bacterium]|nr:hypothetical protein [Candidatus Dormibacteraeota bacterium]
MWKLEQRPRYYDDWWLRSKGPSSSYPSFEEAAKYAAQGEHPEFRREVGGVWVYVDEATGHVHTADLKPAWRIKAGVSETGVQEYDVFDSAEDAAEKAAEGEVPEQILVPTPPGAEIVPRGTADITPPPAGEKELLQKQLAELSARLASLERGSA